MKDIIQYNVYAGTIRGVLAHTETKADSVVHYELSDKENSEITAMEWSRSENEIAVGHKSGTVRLYSTLNNKYTKTIDNLNGVGGIVGIGVYEQTLVCGRHSGHINIWSKMEMHSFCLNLQDESTLECVVHNKSKQNIIGTGGENNDFKLWDIEVQKPIFKAKSMGHDELNLPIRTSVRGACFISNEANLVACATKEGYVLLYDERTQRRPVSKFIEPKASYTTIASAFKEKQCVIGTTKGFIQLLDLRSPAKCVRTYKSFTGAVTSVICDPVFSTVVSTSLDRHVRIHNLETKECMYKKYLKQSLTKLLLKPVLKEKIEESDEKVEEESIDEEYEALFENMETVSEGKKRKKRNDLVIKKDHKKQKYKSAIN